MATISASPIETRLLAGFLTLGATHNLIVRLHLGATWDVSHSRIADGPQGIATAGSGDYFLDIAPQLRILNWNADFVLVLKNARLAIECDGHEFHERTKEQADRDTARARQIQMHIPVIRFTGRQIYRDQQGCADEAVTLLLSQVDLVRQAVADKRLSAEALQLVTKK